MDRRIARARAAIVQEARIAAKPTRCCQAMCERNEDRSERRRRSAGIEGRHLPSPVCRGPQGNRSTKRDSVRSTRAWRALALRQRGNLQGPSRARRPACTRDTRTAAGRIYPAPAACACGTSITTTDDNITAVVNASIKKANDIVLCIILI